MVHHEQSTKNKKIYKTPFGNNAIKHKMGLCPLNLYQPRWTQKHLWTFSSMQPKQN